MENFTSFTKLISEISAEAFTFAKFSLYGLGILMLSFGAYKILSGGTDGMEEAIAVIKRIIIAIFVVGFSVLIVSETLKAVGKNPDSPNSDSGVSAQTFEITT
jgi:hypothetical protein